MSVKTAPTPASIRTKELERQVSELTGRIVRARRLARRTVLTNCGNRTLVNLALDVDNLLSGRVGGDR